MTDKPNTLEMIKEVTQRSVPQTQGGSALTEALLRAAERKQEELKKGYTKHEKYGSIDTRFKDEKPGFKRMAIGALDHVSGGPIGMYMGAVHANRAAKLRQKLGGSPTNTPKDLEGRGWRAVGTVTGGGIGSIIGSTAGHVAMLPAAYAAAKSGRADAARGLILGGKVTGSLAGGAAGSVFAHRRVRDSQIYRRDYEKSQPSMPLAKRFRP